MQIHLTKSLKVVKYPNSRRLSRTLHGKTCFYSLLHLSSLSSAGEEQSRISGFNDFADWEHTLWITACVKQPHWKENEGAPSTAEGDYDTRNSTTICRNHTFDQQNPCLFFSIQNSAVDYSLDGSKSEPRHNNIEGWNDSCWWSHWPPSLWIIGMCVFLYFIFFCTF